MDTLDHNPSMVVVVLVALVPVHHQVVVAHPLFVEVLPLSVVVLPVPVLEMVLALVEDTVVEGTLVSGCIG